MHHGLEACQSIRLSLGIKIIKSLFSKTVCRHILQSADTLLVSTAHELSSFHLATSACRDYFLIFMIEVWCVYLEV